MTTMEILRGARERITDKANWCVGYRWDMSGRNCALGAIEYAMGVRQEPAGLRFTGPTLKYPLVDFGEPAARLTAAAVELWPSLSEGGIVPVGGSIVALFNNMRGHADTLAMFDRAIELEQKHIDAVARTLVESATAVAAEVAA